MKNSDTPQTKNPLEWTVFGISLVLVVTTLALLVFAAFHTQDEPARLTIRSETKQVKDGRLIIPVSVTNHGGEVAANVEVRVTIGKGDALQEAGFTLDFIPRDATRKGVVSFPARKTPTEPVCRIVGYGVP